MLFATRTNMAISLLLCVACGRNVFNTGKYFFISLMTECRLLTMEMLEHDMLQFISINSFFQTHGVNTSPINVRLRKIEQ